MVSKEYLRDLGLLGATERTQLGVGIVCRMKWGHVRDEGQVGMWSFEKDVAKEI